MSPPNHKGVRILDNEVFGYLVSFSCLEEGREELNIQRKEERMLRKFASVEFVLNLESLWLVVVILCSL